MATVDGMPVVTGVGAGAMEERHSPAEKYNARLPGHRPDTHVALLPGDRIQAQTDNKARPGGGVSADRAPPSSNPCGVPATSAENAPHDASGFFSPACRCE
jgi:hypothetical protein